MFPLCPGAASDSATCVSLSQRGTASAPTARRATRSAPGLWTSCHVRAPVCLPPASLHRPTRRSAEPPARPPSPRRRRRRIHELLRQPRKAAPLGAPRDALLLAPPRQPDHLLRLAVRRVQADGRDGGPGGHDVPQRAQEVPQERQAAPRLRRLPRGGERSRLAFLHLFEEHKVLALSRGFIPRAPRRSGTTPGARASTGRTPTSSRRRSQTKATTAGSSRCPTLTRWWSLTPRR